MRTYIHNKSVARGGQKLFERMKKFRSSFDETSK